MTPDPPTTTPLPGGSSPGPAGTRPRARPRARAHRPRTGPPRGVFRGGTRRGLPGRIHRRRYAGVGPGLARSRLTPGLGLTGVLSLAVAVSAGAFHRTTAFLDFGAGVLSLVALTATVLWGLAATDRLVLSSAHRLLAQGVHRGTAVAGLGFLALHIGVKLAEGRISPLAAGVPFADGTRPVLLGLGTLAGYLFLAVAITGAVRGVFASGSGSRRWRALHMCAYPAWGAALVHGLKAGRAADGWVTAAYVLCLLGVAAALALRLWPPGGRGPGAAGRPGGVAGRWAPWRK
ncbi:hypothetical protein [Streptomyces sp. GSL17-111]|uniref:hypothetical protein n=1 Tax=Streptomyces sp. GSL17-111 TaxID=3121596 RepID=UPI0030F48BF9